MNLGGELRQDFELAEGKPVGSDREPKLTALDLVPLRSINVCSKGPEGVVRGIDRPGVSCWSVAASLAPPPLLPVRRPSCQRVILSGSHSVREPSCQEGILSEVKRRPKGARIRSATRAQPKQGKLPDVGS